MTITMAKRARWLPWLAPALLAAPAAQAAWQFSPTLGVRETYTDNVNLQTRELAESRWITELSPGFNLTNVTPRFSLRMDYQLSLYAYSGTRPANTQHNQNRLAADTKARLLEELLFLDATASVSQQASSAFGPQVNGNGYADANRNEVRTYRISPYLVHNFGASANGQLRYSHDSVSTDNIGMRRSDADSITASLSSGSSFRRVGWDAVLMHQNMDDTVPARTAAAEDTQQHSKVDTYNSNLRYLMSPQLSLNGNIGYDRYDYDTLGGRTQGAGYGLGLSWTPSSRTSIVLNGGHRFYGPSYALNLQHRSRGTVWNVTYNDAVTNTRSQFLLPSAVDTAAMLDRLFSPQISDPVQRAAAVQAYIKATGLPPRLQDSINYFSNRFVLQKSLNASVALQAAHTTAVLSLFKMRREALSTQVVDSALLGTSDANLNDNTDQVGGSATVSYKLGPQTVANLSASATNSRSLTENRRDHNRAVRLNLARTFSTKLLGSVEVRRVKGGLGVGQQYTENAVTAALNMKF
jgi:uncharacterized protein (PEP-CTERM system associated)